MDDFVKKMVSIIVDTAKEQAAKLAKELDEKGQLSLPRQLAGVQYNDDDDEEFEIAVILDITRSMPGRLMGATEIKFQVFHNDKFVSERYKSGHMFSRLDSIVNSDDFRQETESMVGKMGSDDFKALKQRIASEGISAIGQLVVPKRSQHEVLKLMDFCMLSIRGHVFAGIEGLMKYWHEQTESSEPYILDRCQRFPCFYAEDFVNEHRFYRNFLICNNKKEADKNAEQMKQLPNSSNFCLVNNNLPDEMRPMVYYMDENMTMLLAY